MVTKPDLWWAPNTPGDGWSRSLISGGHQTHHTKLRRAPFGTIYFEEGGSPASFAAARFICRSVLPVGKKKEGRKGLDKGRTRKKKGKCNPRAA